MLHRRSLLSVCFLGSCWPGLTWKFLERPPSFPLSFLIPPFPPYSPSSTFLPQLSAIHSFALGRPLGKTANTPGEGNTFLSVIKPRKITGFWNHSLAQKSLSFWAFRVMSKLTHYNPTRQLSLLLTDVSAGNCRPKMCQARWKAFFTWIISLKTYQDLTVGIIIILSYRWGK